MTGSRKHQFMRRLLLALLALPLVAAGQSNQPRNLDSILQPTVVAVNPDGSAQVKFTNLGEKEITGFQDSQTYTLASGERVVYNRSGGADFVSSAAYWRAVGGAVPDGVMLLPGQTVSLRLPALPAAADRSPVVGLEVTVAALVFADRTALGDPKRIKFILSSRVQDLARVEAGLAEARSIMASSDPKGALGAHMAQARANGNKSGSLVYLQLLASALARRDPSAVQKLLGYFEAECQALIEHSTLKGGN